MPPGKAAQRSPRVAGQPVQGVLQAAGNAEVVFRGDDDKRVGDKYAVRQGAYRPGEPSASRSSLKTLTDLAAKGIAAEPPGRPGGADGPRTSWITDPDGYRIELVQWPAGHPDGITSADFT